MMVKHQSFVVIRYQGTFMISPTLGKEHDSCQRCMAQRCHGGIARRTSLVIVVPSDGRALAAMLRRFDGGSVIKNLVGIGS